MTTAQVKFNVNRNIDLLDSKSKSTYSVPAAFCDDLLGCGNDTHVRGNVSFNINYREDCDSPVPFLQFSASALVAKTATGSLYGVSGSSSGVTFEADVKKLAEVIANATPTSAQVLTALGITEGATVKFIGPQIVITKTGSAKRVIATIQRPIQENVIDVCGLQIGRRYSGSVSIFGFDTTTCQATTLWQSSASAFVSVEGYAGNLGDDALTDIFTDLKVEAILTAAAAAATCAGVQGLVEAQWASLQGQDLSIGQA